jgi:hypothetical protein
VIVSRDGVHDRLPHQTMRALFLRVLGGSADQLPAQIRSADPSLVFRLFWRLSVQLTIYPVPPVE